jgi:phosphoglycerol transferase MdoB-like AlkP superfamily enzyme
LITYIPNKNIGIERDTIGGLIDVAPTVCNMLGVDLSDALFLGRDLMDKHRGFVIFRDGSYMSENDSMSNALAQERLMISDVILEKDIVSYIRKGITCN